MENLNYGRIYLFISEYSMITVYQKLYFSVSKQVWFRLLYTPAETVFIWRKQEYKFTEI